MSGEIFDGHNLEVKGEGESDTGILQVKARDTATSYNVQDSPRQHRIFWPKYQ